MKKRVYVICLFIFCTIFGLIACSSDEGGGNQTPPDFLVSRTNISFDHLGGSETASITTDASVNWTVSTSQSWITTSSQSGSGSQSLTITVAENTAEQSRNGVVQLQGGSQNREINISQLGAPDDPVIGDPTGMGDFSSVEMAEMLDIGINIGNTLEAICSETAWGNPAINEDLILGIKNAGFTSVRIPVAWSCYFSNAATYEIDESFFARVEDVIDMVIAQDMYAIINIHWDNGWLNDPTFASQDALNARLATMWEQIANRYKDYDYRLLFAGTNEVHVAGDFGEPSQENTIVQNSFNQTFVTTVRNTGGKNYYRYLVVQGYNTNVDHTVNYLDMPSDPTSDRVLVEVHYYDPYQFTLDESSDDAWQWGANATDASATAGWGDEDFLETQFQKLKTTFIDQNIGVVLGEYGAISRDVAGNDGYRADYLKAVTAKALEKGIAPIYWDNGPTTNRTFGLFNRATGEEVFPTLIDAITEN